MKLGITICSIQGLALAVATYIAANEIESILLSGWICSVIGVMAGSAALWNRWTLMAIACFLTPAIGIMLFLLECSLWQLGPQKAALPFCVVFIVNQVVSTLCVLVGIRIVTSNTPTLAMQVTLKTLFVAITSFAIFFSGANYLLKNQHDPMMAIALGMLGVTFVGLCVVLFSATMLSNNSESAG